MMDDGGGRANRVPKRMQTRARAARPAGLSTLCKETKIARTQRSRSATRQALSSFLLQASRVSHHSSVPLPLPFRACLSHPIPSVHFGESAAANHSPVALASSHWGPELKDKRSWAHLLTRVTTVGMLLC
ncbi:hypothetical protein CSPX01_05068 [Colletotrichum filicis]|nr:hypothetical protein CSPX01_05068 [Colletotrichum filicis]